MRGDGKQASDYPWLRVMTRKGRGGFWVLVTQVCSFCENLTSCTLIACALESTQVQHQYKVQGQSEAPTLVPAHPGPRPGGGLVVRSSHCIWSAAPWKNTANQTGLHLDPAGRLPGNAGAPRAWRQRQVLLPAPLYSGADIVRSSELGLPIWDEGLSYLKTQINYSFPTNEQPLASRTSPRITQTPEGSVNPISDTAGRADTRFRRHPAQTALTVACPHHCHPASRVKAQCHVENHSHLASRRGHGTLQQSTRTLTVPRSRRSPFRV